MPMFRRLDMDLNNYLKELETTSKLLDCIYSFFEDPGIDGVEKIDEEISSEFIKKSNDFLNQVQSLFIGFLNELNHLEKKLKLRYKLISCQNALDILGVKKHTAYNTTKFTQMLKTFDVRGKFYLTSGFITRDDLIFYLKHYSAYKSFDRIVEEKITEIDNLFLKE